MIYEHSQVTEEVFPFTKIIQGLIADEYILMNKTSGGLLNEDCGFNNDLPAQMYDTLKLNMHDLTHLLKQYKQIPIQSIEEILQHTRLKNHLERQSKVAYINMLMQDNQLISDKLSETINACQKHGDIAGVMQKLIKRHQGITSQMEAYLKCIFASPIAGSNPVIKN